MEALARAGLGVGAGQTLAAVVGREHGADAGGTAAQERPPLDQMDAVAHLRELAGRLRAGHAAADHEHAVLAVLAHQRVVAGRGVADGGGDDAGRLAGDGGDVAVVHPACPFADVGDLHLEAAREQAMEATGGEVLRAAGEHEPPAGRRLHELEQAALALAAAPVAASDHVGRHETVLERREVDVLHGAGALA